MAFWKFSPPCFPIFMSISLETVELAFKMPFHTFSAVTVYTALFIRTCR
jgi:hypothetical protein